MRHRGVDYIVVQGLGRQLWKWSLSLGEINLKGQAATKAEAVADAERAIERALAPKKVRLFPSNDY